MLSVAHTELATGIERARRRVAQSSYFDLSSVWTFAGALLLPAAARRGRRAWSVYAHLWQRVWRPSGVPLHRHVYTTATVVLAATAAHEVVTGAGGLPADPADVAGALGVVAAVLAYVVVNTVLIAVAIGLSGTPPTPGSSWGAGTTTRWRSPRCAWAGSPPWRSVARRSSWRSRCRRSSCCTGPCGCGTWRRRRASTARPGCSTRPPGAPAPSARWASGPAVRACSSSTSTTSRTVNDQHGHLAGDDVLAAVAGALRSAVRGQDLVGRFGGEEFVVLVGGAAAGTGRAGRAGRRRRAAAQPGRRARGARLDGAVIDGLTASVGAACVGPGEDLERALRAADACLYAAKRGGRNQVRVAGAGAVDVPAPRAAADALRRSTSRADAVP